MPVCQVEEYYLYMSGLEINRGQKGIIEEILSDEGWSNYEFQDDNTTLIVDDIDSESAGESLEDEIRRVLGI